MTIEYLMQAVYGSHYIVVYPDLNALNIKNQFDNFACPYHTYI